MVDQRLITFLTLATIKNFTKAGEILNLTQPAVSQHIKFLEDHYGITLFKKSERTINLTPEGEILFKYGQELAGIERTLERELKNQQGIKRTYQVGATMTIGGYVLPYILGEYKTQHENIDVFLKVNNTKEIIQRLISRKIDLALVEGPFSKKRFKYRKLKDDKLVLAVSPKHDFYGREAVKLEEVLKGRLILRERGSGTREVFENTIMEMGYNLETINTYMEVGSINAIKSLVESNLGYTIISQEAIKREVELGLIAIKPIAGLEIMREFNFVYLEGIAQEFIPFFMDFCSKYYGDSNC